MANQIDNNVIVVPHTHWDREWYLPFEAFRMRLVTMVDGLCDILESDPEGTFHFDGQTIVVEDYEEICGRSERFRKLISDGRIAVGPWYVQPDEFLPSGEAIIRNLQLGIKIGRELGNLEMVGYLPDMFGHMGMMPQIFKGLGINRAVVWRGSPAAVNKCGFIWRSSDGSEVLSAFLPMGYMSGFSLPLAPDKLRGRFMISRGLTGRFIEGPTWLMMAGTDHQQPQRGLIKAMKEAFGGLEGWQVKMGLLRDYFDKLEIESKAKPVITGELRDTHYSPILSSTGSTRINLKKRDFSLSSLIERYLEPLASWAWALGGKDRREFLAYSWKLLLQNQPHDSICGTSTDEVHREMDVRFNKLESVIRRLLHETSIEIGRAVGMKNESPAKAGKVFAVWKPCGITDVPTPIIAEVDFKPDKSAALQSQEVQIPLQMLDEVEPGMILGGASAPAFTADFVLAFLFQDEEMLGGYVVDAEAKMEDNTLAFTLSIGHAPAGFDMEKARVEFEKKIASSGAAMLKVTIKKLPRVRVAAVAPKLTPFSLKQFNLVKSKERAVSAFEFEDNVIESSLWRVVANSDGTLTIHDRKHDITCKNALRYMDEGDRGDEYNFEPVPDEKPINEPARVRVRHLFNGPVAASMRIESTYKVPVGLDKTGKLRSKSSAPLKINTDVLVYKDVPWVDFRASFDNTVRDHRLRVWFEAPFNADEFACETAFEVAKRKACVTPVFHKPDPTDPLSMLIGPEATVGFGPHRGFAAVENAGIGIALFNRGLLEIEAPKGEEGVALALTLARGVGALSRDDMTMRVGHAGPAIATPDAQCMGPQTCEFAFTTYKGSWQEINLAALAHSWRHPALMFRIPATAVGTNGHSPLQTDNPAIEIRALQTAPDGSPALCARLYNTTDKPQKAGLKIAEIFSDYSEADSMGAKIADKHIKRDGAHAATLDLPPARIITVRLEKSK